MTNQNDIEAKANHRMRKSVGRENRLYQLEQQEDLSSPELAEWNGLKRQTNKFEEQYDATLFSDEHHLFKDQHNAALVALCKHLNSTTRITKTEKHNDDDTDTSSTPIQIFYLDGPDAKTTTALQNAGFLNTSLFVANRHKSTCQVLQAKGVHHVVWASATTALHTHFADVDFDAYYLDACGGHAPQIVQMLEAGLKKKSGITCSSSSSSSANDPVPPARFRKIAVGFSVIGGNRNVLDKEVHIVQQLVQMAKRRDMRVTHVFDDPARYGVNNDPSLKKIQGGTMTSWFMLEGQQQQQTVG